MMQSLLNTVIIVVPSTLLVVAIGAMAGYALAWILVYVINVRSFGWTLTMDLKPEYFVQALVVAVGAALLAGIYPSIRVSNMEIASAIREE